ncbi:MAG: hypothetical protein JW983_10650 [Elusimicrobia bacterium]|nr:hypothetical protein [Elusimicrobiota bacterium]
MRKRFFLIILCFFYINIALEAKEKLELPAYIYNSKAIDAKAIAMGEAFTAVSDNASAVYWNPAGVRQVEVGNITVCRKVSEETDADYDELFADNPLEAKKLRFVGLVSLGMALSFKPITRYSGIYQNKQIELKVNQYSLVMSEQYTKRMAIGLSLGYISSQVTMLDTTVPSANVSRGNGLSIGVGLLYEASDSSKIGFSIQNVPGYIWWDDYDRHQLKTHMRTGVSSKPAEWFLVSMDYENIRSTKKEYYHAGIQQTVAENLFFREGIISEDFFRSSDKRAYTCGIGYEIKNFVIDTAVKTYKLDNIDKDKVAEYTISIIIPSHTLGSKVKQR